jgi:hypothetical protein
MVTVKHHNCALFELSPTYTDAVTNANCGICNHHNKTPLTPTTKSCLVHDKHLKWIKEHSRSDWKE